MVKEKDFFEKARNYALQKHKNQKGIDGITPYHHHLEGVVFRLKNLGVSDDDVLSSAWLHDIIEKADTTFEEINGIFGNSISVLVLSLTKNSIISKKESELQYVKQLKNATYDAKLIKLCDISSNVKDISVAPISKTQKIRQIKKLFHYLRIIKSDLKELKDNYPNIQDMVDGINVIGHKFKQRPIII